MKFCDTQIRFAVGCAALIWVCSDGLLLAQDKARSASASNKADKTQVTEPKSAPVKRKRKQKRTQKPLPHNTETMLADKPKPPTPSPQPTAAAPSKRAPIEDDADVRTEGDKSIKTMEFTGLDIEGQLKTPQMLFFLNRLRAEFDRPRLPHRSFMPELEASREDKEL
jgi:type IV secretory pathway VirB10-like protein